MSEPVRGICPRCHARYLVEHCQGVRCRWHKCLNDQCKAVFDLGRRRGYRVSPAAGHPQENLNLHGL